MAISNTDQRLVQAYADIDSGRIKVLSLDIFDTFLWRKVPLPIDLFLMLGKTLKDHGWLIEAVPAEIFPELRIKAEKLARLNAAEIQKLETENAEINLKDIYWQLSGIFKKISIEEMARGAVGIINESDVDELISMEIELERACLVYDQNILNLIYYASKKKVKVILVSDTYFENSHIVKLLDKPPQQSAKDILSHIHRIFLSCENGIGKRRGLFSIIIEHLKVDPSSILHIGDNYISDFKAAEQAGIAALYYKKYDDEFQNVLIHEWPFVDLKLRRQCLDLSHGDYGLTSLRAKMAFHTDLNEIKSEDSSYWKYGAMILGPFLMGFVHWAYDRCRALGQNRVFCLMREGQLYANLIKEYAPYYADFKLQAEELWVSRRFTTHAGIVYGNSQEILTAMTIHPADRFTVDKFCTYLGLDINKFPKLMKNRYVKLDESKFCAEIAEYLSSNEDLREEILKGAVAKRSRYINYLSSLIDLKSINKMVLLDIGWNGTTQGALQVMLRLAGYPVELHGLYLGTTNMTDKALLQGFIREGYLLQMGYPLGALSVVRRGLYVLEQTAISDLGHLLDIDENLNIVVGQSIASPAQKHQAKIVQKGIKAFCHQVGSHIRSGAISWNSLSEALVEQLRQILVRATSFPTTLEAKSFARWGHDHLSLKGGAIHVLGKNQYYEKFIEHMLPVNAFQDWGMTWPFAYAARKDEYLAKTAQVERLEIIPSKCFLSLDSIPLDIYLDLGKGFPKKPQYRSELKSNANRCFYGLEILRSIRKPILGLRIKLRCKNALIYMKSLRLAILHKSGPEKIQMTFFESDEHYEIQSEPKPEESSSVMFKCEEELLLTHYFDLPDIYGMQVNLCFGILCLEGY